MKAIKLQYLKPDKYPDNANYYNSTMIVYTIKDGYAEVTCYPYISYQVYATGVLLTYRSGAYGKKRFFLPKSRLKNSRFKTVHRRNGFKKEEVDND